jgi:hypothetical protein
MEFNYEGFAWFNVQGYRITETKYAVNKHVGWRICIEDGERIKKKLTRTVYVTRYYACVLTPQGWQFAKHRKPYATYEAAVKACQWHERIWQRIEKLSRARGNRLERLTQLAARARCRRRSTVEDLARDNAFWRRPTLFAPDALLAVPAWITLDEKFTKLLVRARIACLKEEDQARAARGIKKLPKKRKAA